MTVERFYLFTLLIDGIHKCIHKMKIDTAPYFGVKSVHIFWVYELHAHPEGLTAAELASRSMISRSLVSREIEMLLQDGYIQMPMSAHGKRKNYNSRITLTEKGEALACTISAEGIRVQNEVSEGISTAELAAFYVTLEKLYRNLKRVAKERESVGTPDAGPKQPRTDNFQQSE
ncbi:MAG: winged helix-turn-helix transcriptional regulator [Clostridia bacterium]|nr:winged helix-turn-helix transcriptional regulator [Clostridia bacterium]